MIFKSPYPEIEIPGVSLPRYVLQHATEFGSRPALIDGANGRVITYAQLNRQVRHTAKSLVERGYRKGDVFAIFSPNLPEFAVAFHAIATIGGVLTSGNPLQSAEEIEEQIRQTGAKCLLTTAPFAEKALAIMERGELREIFTFDHSPLAVPFAELYESVMTPSELPTNALIDPREDEIAIRFTSGASGKPKGVLQTHGACVANLEMLAAVDPIAPNDVFLGVLPMTQSYGSFILLGHALRHGATVVTLPRFKPDTFLQTIERHQVTHVPTIPPTVQMLATHSIIQEYNLRSMKMVYSGATAQSPTLARQCADRLECQVKQAYGLTEAGPAVCFNSDPHDYRPVGKPLPGSELKIVDRASGNALGYNQSGEIRVRGPHLMKGYLRPESGPGFDADGWVLTGDCGYVDESGSLFLEKRVMAGAEPDTR